MYEEPIERLLRIALALNAAVGKRTGIEPLLSTATYSYGFSAPDWDWERIGKETDILKSSIDSFPPSRAGFLRGLVDAFAMMAREGQGDLISYSERVAAYLQVPGERVPQAVIGALREELRGLLVEAGYPDDLAAAVPQWTERVSVHGPELEELGQIILKRAQEETVKRVMPLPPGHHVRLTFPKNYPYRGYSDYSRDYQGRIMLNGDIGWEIPSLKHVICHEAFPGHQTFSAIREQRYREGLMPVEGTLYFSNTPITPIVEGIAEVGQEMLGMRDTPDDRIYDVYNRYQSACTTNLAFDCNADGKDKETAVREFMAAAFVTRTFAEKRYHFWTNPLWQTGFPHYWYGREFMRECYALMKGHMPAFVRMVYTEPHTVSTLRAAVQAYVAAPAAQ